MTSDHDKNSQICAVSRELAIFLFFFFTVSAYCFDGAPADTARNDTIYKTSPSGALFRSAVLPGWGQYYNSQKFKAGLFAGAGLGLVSAAVIQHQRAVNASMPEDRTSYTRSRNRMLWYAGALWAVNMLDAFIYPHLKYGDDISGAIIRSAILPGWGQYYNGMWFKAILVLGGELGLISAAVIQHQRAVQTDIPEAREFYENDRSRWIWYSVGFWLLNIIDALVDAHLKDFDVDPDLSFQPGPRPNFTARLRWRIALDSP